MKDTCRPLLQHRGIGALLFALLALAACGGDGGGDGTPQDPTAVAFGLEERPVNEHCLAPARPRSQATVALELALGFGFPTAMVHPPQDTSRWHVVDRSGYINVYQDGGAFSPLGTFADLRDRVFRAQDGREMGLLAMAFHPDFADNGYVYLYYTAEGSDTLYEGRLSRFVSRDDGLSLDPDSERIILTTGRDRPWHWGGGLAFGADGYLYLSVGDGGQATNGQALEVLEGKLLRIDVDGGEPYAIPADNPFAAGGGRPEIFALGLRNPWRWSFDRLTGDIWLGDVGNRAYEEVNLVTRGGNYGWNVREGAHCAYSQTSCATEGLTDPVFEYAHTGDSNTNAIIGGYVYRGSQLRDLQGAYLFANFTGILYALRLDEEGNARPEILLEGSEFINGFSESSDGELYVLTENGVYRLINGDPDASVEDGFPRTLSATGCFDPADVSQPGPGLIPYTVNAPLWSDGAGKQRWMALPEDTRIGQSPNGDLDFPIGTVLIKTFSLGDRLVETRLFMRHADGGWGGYSYAWNEEQTDAELLPSEDRRRIEGIDWHFPSRNQCMQCHTEVAGRSLGLEIAQLNGDLVYPATGVRANQLDTLAHIGLFEASLPARRPALSALADTAQPLQQRARSYLHANCAFCHQPDGPGQGPEDFRYWLSDEEIGAIGVAPTQGNAGVPGASLIAPGEPERSVLSLRLHALDDQRMPPLGTSLVDEEGVAVIDAWIESLRF